MFSLGATASGSGGISVTVGGVTSNILPFAVRSGNILHVKTTGNDTTGDGSWSKPYATIIRTTRAMSAGDIAYIHNGVNENDISISYLDYAKIGTSANPFSLIVYPKAVATINSTTANYGAFNNHNSNNAYWHFSKFKILTSGVGIAEFKGSRTISNEITNYPASCPSGTAGAITSNGGDANTSSGIICLGNYIHDYGCISTSTQQHTFYISNRTGSSVIAYELGWNYINTSYGNGGLHIYDEGACGDWSGTFLIHDNVVASQRADAFDYNTGCSEGVITTTPAKVYNNLFINVGLSGGSQGVGIYIGGSSNHATIDFFNNTLVGYAYSGCGGGLACGAIAIDPAFAGTFNYKNNLVVDTNNFPFVIADSDFNGIPASHTNNLWYSSYSNTAPTWDTTPVTSDPLFTNSGSNDFSLQAGSPALNTGANLTATVPSDFLGNLRPTSYPSIGAFDTIGSSPPATPKGGMMGGKFSGMKW
jgi:hypothetical protein